MIICMHHNGSQSEFIYEVLNLWASQIAGWPRVMASTKCHFVNNYLDYSNCGQFVEFIVGQQTLFKTSNKIEKCFQW